MRAYKICFSSIVLDERYGSVEGMEYYEVEIDGQLIRFAQHNNTVLPAMLEQLVSLSVLSSNGA